LVFHYRKDASLYIFQQVYDFTRKRGHQPDLDVSCRGMFSGIGQTLLDNAVYVYLSVEIEPQPIHTGRGKVHSQPCFSRKILAVLKNSLDKSQLIQAWRT